MLASTRPVAGSSAHRRSPSSRKAAPWTSRTPSWGRTVETRKPSGRRHSTRAPPALTASTPPPREATARPSATAWSSAPASTGSRRPKRMPARVDSGEVPVAGRGEQAARAVGGRAREVAEAAVDADAVQQTAVGRVDLEHPLRAPDPERVAAPEHAERDHRLAAGSAQREPLHHPPGTRVDPVQRPVGGPEEAPAPAQRPDGAPGRGQRDPPPQRQAPGHPPAAPVDAHELLAPEVVDPHVPARDGQRAQVLAELEPHHGRLRPRPRAPAQQREAQPHRRP